MPLRLMLPEFSEMPPGGGGGVLPKTYPQGRRRRGCWAGKGSVGSAAPTDGVRRCRPRRRLLHPLGGALRS